MTMTTIHFLVVLLCLTAVMGHTGTYFLLVAPPNVQDTVAYHQYRLLIEAAPEVTETINVDVTGTASYNMDPGNSSEVLLQDQYTLPNVSSKFTGHTFTVHTSAPVSVVLNHESKGGSNYGSYLALPIDYLGREYFAFTYKNSDNETGQFLDVAAVYSNTYVQIRLPKPKNESNFAVDYDGVTYTAGDVITVELNAEKVMQLYSNYDLTGAHVRSNMPVAVWSGVKRTMIQTSCHSHLVEMLMPTQGYGTQYILAPANINNQLFRVVSKEFSTTIVLHRQDSLPEETWYIPDSGGFVDIWLQDPTSFMYLESDKEIAVMGYMAGREPFGDASMRTILPLGYSYPSQYRFTMKLDRNLYYVTITFIIARGSESRLRLEGQTITSSPDLDSGPVFYNVTNNENLIGGRFTLTGNSPGKGYDLEQLDGEPFIAYLVLTANCVGSSIPLTYPDYRDKLTNDPHIIPMSGGKCDYVLDSLGQPVNSLECNMLFNNYEHQCVENSVKVDCPVTPVRTHSCKKMDYIHLAARTTVLSASSIITCLNLCSKTPSCVGVNFAKRNDVADNCQLLLDQIQGTEPSDGIWNNLRCSTQLGEVSTTAPTTPGYFGMYVAQDTSTTFGSMTQETTAGTPI